MSLCLMFILAVVGVAAGTEPHFELVDDIYPGPTSSYANAIGPCGDKILISAIDESHGCELWISDGTSHGTTLLKDINPGLADSNPHYIGALNGVAYLDAITTPSLLGLWRTDGTEGGTQLVKVILPYRVSIIPVAVLDNRQLFFCVDSYNNPLWVSDGTSSGTIMLVNSNYTSHPDKAVMGGQLYIEQADPVHGVELWVSDGTVQGTKLFKDINPGSNWGMYIQNYGEMAAGQDVLYFSGDDGVHDSELWKSDGTAQGTVMVKDINTGYGRGAPTDMVVIDNIAYFQANQAATGRELWRSDGTEAGTWLVKDLYSGYMSGFPRAITKCGQHIYLVGNTGDAISSLWKLDGTTGHIEVISNFNLHSNPILQISGNKLFFVATKGNDSSKLYMLDDDTGVSQELLKINSTYTNHIYNGVLYVSTGAINSAYGTELWRLSWEKAESKGWAAYR